MKKRMMSMRLAVVMLASSVDITVLAVEVSAVDMEALGGDYTEAETQEERL